MTHNVLDDFVAGENEDLLAVAKIIRGSRRSPRAPDRGVGVGRRGDHRRDRRDLRLGRRRLVPAIVARTLWFTHRSMFVAALNGLLEERTASTSPPDACTRSPTAAYDQLAGGLGEYGKRG